MAKVNKERTEDLFAGIKYVDKLMNESAGVGNPPKKLSFEDKMKKKLKEGYDEAAELEETEDLDEYSSHAQSHGYNYDGKTAYMEDDMEAEFGEPVDEFEDEFGDEFSDELGNDPFETQNSSARRFASRDMENEFEPEMEEEFDFTEDLDLMESLLGEAEPALDIPDDETAPIEATPTDETGDIDMTTDAGLGSQDGVDTGADMGADLESEPGTEPEMDDLGGEEGMDDLGSPSMGGSSSMGGAPMGTEPTGMEAPATSPTDGAEDIDQLIADLVASPETEEAPAVFGENAHTDLGFKGLKDQDINSNKVKMESKKGVNPFAKKAEDDKKEKEAKDKKKSVKEGEIKLTKLGDADITGNVKGASTGEKVVHSGTGKRVDPKGEEFTDLGDEDITSGKVKATEKAAASTQPKFNSLVKENADKTKALYTLAEKVITLEDEVSNLKFKSFKLEKVNSVLTLLPELKLATREKLVEKFDSCKSYAETKKLYAEVAEMVKDHKRGSINEAVIKTQKSSVNYFAEGIDNESNATEDKEQARRNLLMGLKGNDDAYGRY